MHPIRQLLAIGKNSKPTKRCLRILETPATAVTEDIVRLCLPRQNESNPVAKPLGGIFGVLRRYGDSFRPKDDWLVIFEDAADAKIALKRIIGQRLGYKLSSPILESTMKIDDFFPVNILMDKAANCVLLSGHPPATTGEQYLKVLSSFSLKKSLTSPPLRFEPNGKSCLVEFEDREEAHRAIRLLDGKEYDFEGERSYRIRASPMA